MEREMLKKLEYKISGPTVYDFLQRFAAFMQYDEK
jgi:hypothetical protein